MNGEERRFSTLPKITLNDAPASLSAVLREGDVIVYEETSVPTIDTVLDISAAASYATITYEGREHAIPASGFALTINGREASPGTVVEDGAVIAYQKGTGSANVSEALLAVGFTPPPATSRVTFTILVNGEKADFTTPVRTGDTLEVAFTPLERLSSAAPAPDAGAPAASTILSGIAARAGLPQTELPAQEQAPLPEGDAEDTAEQKQTEADPQSEPASPAPAQSGTISIESLMRYD